MSSISESISNDLSNDLPHIIIRVLQEKLPVIIIAAMDSYNLAFSGVSIDNNSLSNPDNFFDSYVTKIKKFEYFSFNEETEELKLKLPTEETFNFDGELTILKFIVEGVVGSFLELPEKDLVKVINTQDLSADVKSVLVSLPGMEGEDVPLEFRFKLVPTNSTLPTIIKSILGRELIKFPFSNTPPINIFEYLYAYVNFNVPTWIDEGINTTIVKITEGK